MFRISNQNGRLDTRLISAGSDIASYAGSNRVLTAQALEVSRAGSPDESVTVRDLSGMDGKPVRFLRVSATRP